MQKNLSNLNDLLFKQLQRLEELDTKSTLEVQAEIERAKAVTIVSTKVIDSAQLALDVSRFAATHKDQKIPQMLLDGPSPKLSVIES